MDSKKGFKIYYLLLSEGTTEFNLFAYLTKVRFREFFDNSSVQFRNSVEIIKDGNQIVSQGKLDGVSDITHFKSKHILIKKKYASQRLFYFLDNDMDDSSAIEKLITKDGDLVQFTQYNSEHLLLRLAGKKPKNPSDFGNLKNFRDYCKQEFVKQFGKNAHKFKDADFELVFNIPTENAIRASLSILFSTLEQE
ncbi:hypothetical protein KAI92_04585 [Candidatus Parcubacteria bacterium]|nr:hypothetical protein [Candidatus Parcubacteria bacterium]